MDAQTKCQMPEFLKWLYWLFLNKDAFAVLYAEGYNSENVFWEMENSMS